MSSFLYKSLTALIVVHTGVVVPIVFLALGGVVSTIVTLFTLLMVGVLLYFYVAEIGKENRKARVKLSVQ